MICYLCEDRGVVQRNDPNRPLGFCPGIGCTARERWKQTRLGRLVEKHAWDDLKDELATDAQPE